MAYVTAQARQRLLEAVGEIVGSIGAALAALGEAYEQLDEAGAERLESELFRPVQAAYARATRTHAGFARRHELDARPFAPETRGHPSQGVKGFVEAAVAAVREAEAGLVALQDSMLPVEVGDEDLRAGMAEVRGLLDELPGRARRFVSLLGR